MEESQDSVQEFCEACEPVPRNGNHRAMFSSSDEEEASLFRRRPRSSLAVMNRKKPLNMFDTQVSNMEESQTMESTNCAENLMTVTGGQIVTQSFAKKRKATSRVGTSRVRNKLSKKNCLEENVCQVLISLSHVRKCSMRVEQFGLHMLCFNIHHLITFYFKFH